MGFYVPGKETQNESCALARHLGRIPTEKKQTNTIRKGFRFLLDAKVSTRKKGRNCLLPYGSTSFIEDVAASGCDKTCQLGLCIISRLL
mmetsp:Transcript_9250/g.10546  ORF Transcript_9250/g.10546 Transcript_9250/m.10546 type:complete len:89 (+) Transcript_9250:1816-2082(+)